MDIMNSQCGFCSGNTPRCFEPSINLVRNSTFPNLSLGGETFLKNSHRALFLSSSKYRASAEAHRDFPAGLHHAFGSLRTTTQSPNLSSFKRPPLSSSA